MMILLSIVSVRTRLQAMNFLFLLIGMQFEGNLARLIILYAAILLLTKRHKSFEVRYLLSAVILIVLFVTQSTGYIWVDQLDNF